MRAMPPASLFERDRTAQYGGINEALYDWYLLAVSKNIFPDGSELVLKAKEIADRIGVHDFKGSNGWLEKWKLRYNIRQMTISGESGGVSGDTITSWKERLPEILSLLTGFHLGGGGRRGHSLPLGSWLPPLRVATIHTCNTCTSKRFYQ